MELESTVTGFVQSGLFLTGGLVVIGIMISVPIGVVLILLKTHKKPGVFLALWPLVLVGIILILFAIANLFI